MWGMFRQVNLSPPHHRIQMFFSCVRNHCNLIESGIASLRSVEIWRWIGFSTLVLGVELFATCFFLWFNRKCELVLDPKLVADERFVVREGYQCPQRIFHSLVLIWGLDLFEWMCVEVAFILLHVKLKSWTIPHFGWYQKHLTALYIFFFSPIASKK